MQNKKNTGEGIAPARKPVRRNKTSDKQVTKKNVARKVYNTFKLPIQISFLGGLNEIGKNIYPSYS